MSKMTSYNDSGCTIPPVQTTTLFRDNNWKPIHIEPGYGSTIIIRYSDGLMDIYGVMDVWSEMLLSIAERWIEPIAWCYVPEWDMNEVTP